MATAGTIQLGEPSNTTKTNRWEKNLWDSEFGPELHSQSGSPSPRSDMTNGPGCCNCCPGPSGLHGDTTSKKGYCCILWTLLIIEIIGIITVPYVDIMAAVNWPTGGDEYILHMQWVEVELSHFSEGEDEEASYNQICKDNIDNNSIFKQRDFDGCSARKGGDLFIICILLSFTSWFIGIILLSNIVCCGPKGCCKCCNNSNCCQCFYKKTCCKGLCLKKSITLSMIAVFLLNLIGCILWSAHVTPSDLCADGNWGCGTGFGPSWIVTLLSGILNFIMIFILYYKNIKICSFLY